LGEFQAKFSSMQNLQLHVEKLQLCVSQNSDE